MLIIILIVLFGYFLVGIFYKNSKFIERLSLGYGIGLGIISYLIFILSLLDIAITKTTVLLLLLTGFFLLRKNVILEILKIKRTIVNLKSISVNVFGFGMKLAIIQILVFFLLIIFLYIRRMGILYFIDLNIFVLLFAVVFMMVYFCFRFLGKWLKIDPFFRNILNLESLEFILIILIVDVFLASLILNLYWPIYSWDALTMFDSRARIFLDQGKTILYKDQFAISYLTAYPFMSSIYHYLVYLFGGLNPKFIYSCFYLFLGLGFYSFLRKYKTRVICLSFTLLLLLTPIFFYHSTIAYTNLSFVYYFSIGLLYFYQGIVRKDKGELFIGGILFGLTVWLRPGVEIFFISTLFGVIVYGVIKKNIRPALLLLFFYLFFSLSWLYYTRVMLAIDAYDSIRAGVGLLDKFRIDIDGLKIIVQGFWDLQSNASEFGSALYLTIFTLVFFADRVYRKTFLVFLVSLNILAWVFLGYAQGLLRNFDHTWYAIFYDSMKRISMAFIPLYLFIVAYCWNLSFFNVKSKKTKHNIEKKKSK